jgi:hypothetical protein
VRDIVDRQKISAIAALDIAARNRETVLRNAYLKAKRQTERGAEMTPTAFIIPADQHDPLTVRKMIDKLLGQGIEVQVAADEFTHDGRLYGAGTYVVSLAQPKMGVTRWLLGRTFYPDNTYTRDDDGNPIRPYDMSTDNMAEFMGVRVDEVDEMVATDLSVVTSLGAYPSAMAQTAAGQHGFAFGGNLNDSFHAMNLLFDARVDVRRVVEAVDVPGGDGPTPGDFLVPADAPAELLAQITGETGVPFRPLAMDAAAASRPMSRQRIGMYQRFYGGNMDEGWTRLLLEMFGFPYDSLFDADLTAGNLNARYDVIILPADGVSRMTGERGEGGGGGGFYGSGPEAYPPEYRSGFGQEGVDALEAFVENGGTLVTFAQAGDLPIEKFGLPVRNVLAGLSSTEFWSPGSTLKVEFDNENPLAYGMPSDGLATFLAGSQVYQVTPSARNERVERIVTYVDRDLLQSGWLIGEDEIAEKAAVVSVEHGQGRVVLIGFRAQHRVQTHGTFKLVFNALVD